MRKYSLLHPFLLSFYSRELYRDAARHWRFRSFLYLLILMAVTWLPAMSAIDRSWKQFADGNGRALVDQLPPISIAGGKVSVEAPQPHYINDPESGKALVILDTTGQVTSLDGTGAQFLLTDKRVMIRKSPTETNIYDLSNVASLRIDKALAARWLEIGKQWAAVALYPLLVLFSYAFRCAQVLVYAAIGIPVARAVGARVGYLGLISIAAMAVTPVIVIRTVMGFTDLKVPFAWLLGFGVAMLYLGYGVKANAASPEIPPP